MHNSAPCNPCLCLTISYLLRLWSHSTLLLESCIYEDYLYNVIIHTPHTSSLLKTVFLYMLHIHTLVINFQPSAQDTVFNNHKHRLVRRFRWITVLQNLTVCLSRQVEYESRWEYSRGRFVQKQDRWVADELQRDGQPFLLTAGERPCASTGVLIQSQHV